MTGEDMWQLIMFSTKFFGVPIFSENGKTLIRFTFGSSPKSEAHDISIFLGLRRVEI